MTATVKINLSTPQAVSLVNYLETLPFAEVHIAGKKSFEPIPGLAYSNEERAAAIKESLADFEAGLVYTSDEVFKPYEQWL